MKELRDQDERAKKSLSPQKGLKRDLIEKKRGAPLKRGWAERMRPEL
jgi:hypothetical protein